MEYTEDDFTDALIDAICGEDGAVTEDYAIALNQAMFRDEQTALDSIGTYAVACYEYAERNGLTEEYNQSIEGWIKTFTKDESIR